MAKKILVVDDSASIRQLVNFALKQGANAGKYEVIEAADGIEGAAALKNHKFDLIFTDINMPRMNGMDFIKEARKVTQVPILTLTTESSDTMKQQARMIGATGWLVKPFDPQKLVDVVKKVIG